jgi:hypothetical protein
MGDSTAPFDSADTHSGRSQPAHRLAPAEQRRHAEWPRSAGKSRAFCRPPNEDEAFVRGKRRRRLSANKQATFSQ